MVKVTMKMLKLFLVSCFLLLVSSKGQSSRLPIGKIIPHSPSISEYTHTTKKTNHCHQLWKNMDWFAIEKKKRKKEIQLKQKNKSLEIWTITAFSIFSYLSKQEQRIVTKSLTWMRQNITICPDNIIQYLFQHPKESDTWVFSTRFQKILLFLSSITTIQEIRTNGINSIRRRYVLFHTFNSFRPQKKTCRI